jgi:arylsulfatase A-like enzyme
MAKARRPESQTATRGVTRLVAALVACAAAIVVALSSGGVACHRAPAQPNVILISIDCLNERQIEAARERHFAPHLAALAEQSLVFTNAHAQAPWTTPSHMSMLTGLYPHEHGRDVPWRIMVKSNATYDREPTHPTLASRLAAAGYETIGVVGKGSISAQYGLGRGFASYHEIERNADRSDIEESVATVRTWLTQRHPRPFFLFLHTYDLHPPLPHGLVHPRDAIARIDDFLGALFAEFERQGAWDSSLIFLTGDHGSQMRAVPGRCCTHGTGHYEENLRVPLVVKLPQSSLKGFSDALVRHIDILPTALAVTGQPVGDYRGQGVSLLDVFAGRHRPDHSFSAADGRCAERYAIVTERYKYILTPHTEAQTALRQNPLFYDRNCPTACLTLPPEEELFDLTSDPEELTNLLAPGAPQTAEVTAAARALRLLLEHDRALPPQYTKRVPTTARPSDPSVNEALKALGYIDGGSPTPTPAPTPARTPKKVRAPRKEVFLRLSSRMSSSSETTTPSTRTRVKPARPSRCVLRARRARTR